MNRRPFVLAASIAALIAHSATAQTSTGWLGASPGNLWSATANWSNGAPSGGDNLFFGLDFITAGGTGSLISNNDLAGYNGYRITFEDTAAPVDPAFTINGNALTLSNSGVDAPRIENQSSSLQTIALGGMLTLNGGATNVAQINPLNGDLLVSNAITLAAGTQLRVNGGTGHTVTFGGIISGSGNTVAINQNSNVVYAAANTYTGDTFINAGSLAFAQGGSLTSGTLQLGDTTGAAAARLQISDADGGTTIARPIVVRAGSTGTKTIAASNTAGTNTFSGTVALNDHVTVDTAAGGALTMSGVISGTNSVTKTGNGLLTLSAANNFSGGLILNGGNTRLTVANSISGGITVNTGGTLEANTAAADSNAFNNLFGAAGNGITLNGGRMLVSNNADRSTINRAFTIGAAGGTFDVNGTSYTDFLEVGANQLRLTATTGGIPSILNGAGTVTKNGPGRLTVSGGSSPSFTGAVIINNGTLEASGAGLGTAVVSNTITLNGGNWAMSGDSSQAITLNGGAISTNGASRTANGAINVNAESYIFLNEFWRDFDSANPTAILARNLTVNGILSGDDPLGVAVNRTLWTSNNGTVILKNPANTYSGTITVGKNLRLESNPTGGTGNTFGTASIVLAGGGLNLRDNGGGTGGLISYGNDVAVINPTGIFDRGIMAASVTIDVNRASGTNVNNIITLGSLTIAGQPLNVTGGNGYGVAFTGLSQINGNATFNVNSASLTFSGGLIEDAAGRNLTKNGNAALIFSSAAAHTGATAINGGSIVLNELGQLIGTTSISLARGTSLVIDNSAFTQANRVDDDASITMNGASLTLNSELASIVNSDEQVGAVTLTGGVNTIAANRNNGGAISALTLASLTRQGTATVNFVGTNLGEPGTNSRIIITGQAASPFLGPWATLSDGFARYSTDADADPATGITAVESIDDPINDTLLTATDNLRLVGSDLALSANRSVNTVTFANPTNGRILDLATHTLTVASGGILVATNSSAINGTGGITAGTSDLIITNHAALNIAAPIKDGVNPVSLVKTGTGTLTLSGANTFTGNISVTQGTLALNDVTDLLTPGSLGLNADVSLSSENLPTTLQLIGATDSTDHNLLIGAPGATIDVTTAASNYSWNGTVISSGPVTKVGPGTLTLGATANLTGNLSVSAGTLEFAGPTSLAGTATVSGSGTLRIRGSTQITGDLNVGINATVGSVTGAAGGILSVGSGSTNSVNIGGRNNGINASTMGTVDLSLADGFNANVGNFRIQSDFGTTTSDGAMAGSLRLPDSNTAVNSITASTQFTVGDSPQAGGSSVAALALGGGSTTIQTPVLLIGGRKVSANATIGAGGTLTVNNGAARTTFNVGVNNVDTGTAPVTTVNFNGGTLIADLSSLTVGLKTSGGNAGKVTATLDLGASSTNDVDINATTGNALRIGQYEFTANNTQPVTGQANGTLIVGGGNVSIVAQSTTSSAVLIGHFNNTTTTITGATSTNSATGILTINGGNVTINSGGTMSAINIAQRTVAGTPGGSQTSTGTLNINGGSLTVNNAIVGNGSTAHADSTSQINVTGGTLNMQGKNITNITEFNFIGGTLKDVGTLNRSLVQIGESSLLDVALFNTTISNSGTYTVTDGNVNVASTRTLSVPAGIALNGTATMILNGTLSGALTVNAGATVGGAGTSAVLNLAGGTIAPGNSPGILKTGNLSLSGGNLALEFNGNTVGTGYDQLNVTGTVSLSANTNLSLSFGYVPAIGEKFTIINNDLADTLSFSNGALFTYNNGAGISDDATFTTIEGMEFRLDYNDGGNDVTLTTLVPEPTSAVTFLAGLGALLVSRRPRRRA